MIEKIKKTREYLDYLEEHYNNVQKAWKLINDKCQDMHFIYDDYCYWVIDYAVKHHDDSKLSKEEFTEYREHFYPVDDKEKCKLDKAWEHHKDKNNHHWENWTNENKGLDPYPDIYVALTVIDWVAMGFKFNDGAQSYYELNKDKINIPEWAEKIMYEIFERIY